jgi:hypothetical protein
VNKTPNAAPAPDDGMVLVPREIVANYANRTHIRRHRRICEAALTAPTSAATPGGPVASAAPGAVDDAMVERAFDAYLAALVAVHNNGNSREAMRAALTAALAHPKTDGPRVGGEE